MPTLEVYDPAMCCATGVCGPQVDATLVRFAADVKWLQGEGVEVRRYGLSQNPSAYVENPVVRGALTEAGESALPLTLVDGGIVAMGVYPTRDQLADWLGLSALGSSLFTPAVAELVAIGASIACNCQSCLRYHVKAAGALGVSTADIARAVEQGAKVKDAPHQAILNLAARLMQFDSHAPAVLPPRARSEAKGD